MWIKTRRRNRNQLKSRSLFLKKMRKIQKILFSWSMIRRKITIWSKRISNVILVKLCSCHIFLMSPVFSKLQTSLSSTLHQIIFHLLTIAYSICLNSISLVIWEIILSIQISKRQWQVRLLMWRDYPSVEGKRIKHRKQVIIKSHSLSKVGLMTALSLITWSQTNTTRKETDQWALVAYKESNSSSWSRL